MSYLSRIKSDPIVFVLVVLFAIGAWFSYAKRGAPPKADKPAVNEARLPGKLVIENDFHDFGEVMEGDIVKHTFTFKNEGQGPLRIVKTETSCGCTTASGAEREYAPGERGEMEVTIDTKGKKGAVVKTVTVYMENGEKPTAALNLAMMLVQPPHPKVENVLNINKDGKCKTCHLESGQGQTGIFLYHRVCAQCHGRKGTGGSARAFNDGKWAGAVDDAYIRKVVSEGLPERGMPSYVKDVDPPLTMEQVDTLIKYIRGLEQKE